MKACEIPGCTRRHSRNGMCSAHDYRRLTGLPMDVPIGSIPRNRPKPFDTQYIVTDAGCWEWQGYISTGGYGCYGRAYAHRVSYERHKGPIPEGLQIDHLCRTRTCVNPDHLEAVTPQVNVLRGSAPSAVAARTGVCLEGHALTPENAYTYNNKRHCRTCRRQKRKQRTARDRERRLSA